MDWILNHTLSVIQSPSLLATKCFHHQLYQATLGKERGNLPSIFHCSCLDHRCFFGLGTVTWEGFQPPRHYVRATSCSAGTVPTNSFPHSKADTADSLRTELEYKVGGRAGHSNLLLLSFPSCRLFCTGECVGRGVVILKIV